MWTVKPTKSETETFTETDEVSKLHRETFISLLLARLLQLIVQMLASCKKNFTGSVEEHIARRVQMPAEF